MPVLKGQRVFLAVKRVLMGIPLHLFLCAAGLVGADELGYGSYGGYDTIIRSGQNQMSGTSYDQ